MWSATDDESVRWTYFGATVSITKTGGAEKLGIAKHNSPFLCRHNQADTSDDRRRHKLRLTGLCWFAFMCEIHTWILEESSPVP